MSSETITDADGVAQSLDAATFRRALGGFPTGVTVVTAGIQGQFVGMTANSFSSVSLDPPLVSWCVASNAQSHDLFVAADAYAVHFLGADHHETALRFAGKTGDKFAGITHRPGRSGAPVIQGLAPVLECRTWARYPGGDHTILVGEVVNVIERVQDPLLFHSGVLRGFEGSRPHPEPAPDSIVGSELAYLLARTSQLVSAEFDARLRDFGLTAAEWWVLARLGDAEGLGVVELSAMTLMKSSRMTEILDRLSRGALIERRPDPADSRRVLIHLTEDGRAKLAPALAAAQAHEAALLRLFSSEERATIKQALDLLIERHGEAGLTGE